MNALRVIHRWQIGFVAAALSLAAGCITNPETGRRQLLLVSESEMSQLGLSSFEQMKKEVPVSKDTAANALLQRVGKRIASVVNLPGAQWEFVVFESKEANAFCLPGGKIGVYTGILPITRAWYSLGPGIALLISVLAFNLVGDGFRDALDPRLR
jgi:predicted Zn-dependent protease